MTLLLNVPPETMASRTLLMEIPPFGKVQSALLAARLPVNPQCSCQGRKSPQPEERSSRFRAFRSVAGVLVGS
ncbi:MAG: hypothetical protein E5Y56_00940 [Mesorhizobium sp.]|nr:MAG: hypothetical protein E5Y56_00940 [Mesorhizobium sp.]